MNMVDIIPTKDKEIKSSDIKEKYKEINAILILLIPILAIFCTCLTKVLIYSHNSHSLKKYIICTLHYAFISSSSFFYLPMNTLSVGSDGSLMPLLQTVRTRKL